MGEDPGQERARELADDPQKSAAQLRGEIEDVREDLGETAAALAAKTDVKARAREKADELKRSATSRKDELLSKAPGRAGTTPSSASTGGSAAVTQMKRKARENPVPTAALGALIGGFLLGRLTRRDD
jgi:ElaB/YqjD/DUF883 family membrane-anchored ribosome-binding protein